MPMISALRSSTSLGAWILTKCVFRSNESWRGDDDKNRL